MSGKNVPLDNKHVGRSRVGGINVIATQTTFIKLKVQFEPLKEAERNKYLECLDGVLYSDAGNPGHRKLEAYVEENNLNVKVIKSIFMGRQYRGEVKCAAVASKKLKEE